MKRIVAFALMLVLVLACLAPAIAATAQLSAAAHGGFTRSASVTKTVTGNPSVTLSSLTNLDEGLTVGIAVVYANGASATGYCYKSSTGSCPLYYSPSSGASDAVGTSFSVALTTKSAQSRTVSAIISWRP